MELYQNHLMQEGSQDTINSSRFQKP